MLFRSFPHVDTSNEGRSLLMVYERAQSITGDDLSEQPEGEKRDVVYSLPLPFDKAPEEVLVKDRLALVAAGTDGVAVVSLADPDRPAVIRRITTAMVAGRNVSINALDITVIGDHLHVVSILGKRRHNLVFDLSRPSLAQLGAQDVSSEKLEGLSQQSRYATAGEVSLFDTRQPAYQKLLSAYNGYGYTVPGKSKAVDGLGSLFANYTRIDEPYKPPIPYLAIYDMSRPSEGIMLLDALKVPLDSLRKPLTENQVDIAWNSDPFLFTDDGLLIFAVTKKEGYGVLSIVDSLSQDLVWSSPAQGETHVARDAEITLRFALPLEGASSDRKSVV